MLFRIYAQIMALLICIFCRFSVREADNIPEGKALICGNHTSLMDPVYVAVGMYSKRKLTMKFVAKSELAKVPVLSWLIRPLVVFVDRGKSDLAAIRAIMDSINHGNKIMIFPEGTRAEEGEILQAKTGVSLLALKTSSPIVPVFVTPGKKPLWKFPKVDVIFGKPYVPARDPQKPLSENYRIIADEVMARISELNPN